ncbi:DNA-binding transcriptional LysR family regulator [Deinobacterium chartae]|uniref:DNA-binding transcriptional LysR family regulator n=1 Tax=Deinobacterium chartae TaxID=521158 RepID=A0A841HZ10_9DEIO|nr:DNA-binding transcriptional LysR family regulator [Deinobacterium chartae]
MELKQLRYFVALAEELHFGRAAERLGLTQPPLSRQMRALEDDLGVRLFRRSTQRVELTEAGRALLPEARALLERAETAARHARRAARGETGRLEVGFTLPMTWEQLSVLIAHLQVPYPEAKVTLHDLSSLEVTAGVRSGHLDAGFVLLPAEAPQLGMAALWTEPPAVLLPARHPLAERHALSLADLAPEGFVLPSREPAYAGAVIRACQRAGFTPKVVQEAVRLSTVMGLVAGGLGVSVIPASVEHILPVGAVARPLIRPGFDTGLGLAHPRRAHAPLLAAFLEEARRVVRPLPPEA